MNAPPSPLDPALQARIDAHLDAIDRVLTAQDTPRTQRQAVTAEVESQVRDMLAARTAGKPTLAELDAILAELDPPEAYAEEKSAGPPAMTAPVGPARVSKMAVWSAALAATGLAGCVLVLLGGFIGKVHAGSGPGPQPVESNLFPILYGAISLLMAVGGLLVSPILGMAAISQIRHSGGKLTGLSLAAMGELTTPLLILDALVTVVVAMSGFYLLEPLPKSPAPPLHTFPSLFVVVGLIFSILLDWGIVRRHWRALSRPTGGCQRCGYDLRGSKGPCPECGVTKE